MLIDNGDGTQTGGPLDVLCILHDVERRTYHAAFFEESPMPGPVHDVMDTDVVRLKSNMHHTSGAGDLAGAQAHLDNLAKKIVVAGDNVARATSVPWDGTIGLTWAVRNWKKSGASVETVLARAA